MKNFYSLSNQKYRKQININSSISASSIINMRIRSIKYKSSTANLFQQTNSQSSPFYSRARLMNSETSESQSNINNGKGQKYQGRQLFTENYLNVMRQEGSSNDMEFENKSSMVMNGFGNRTAIKSEKIASKPSSMHQENKLYGDKENRTSIFMGKNKGLVKGMESLSVHEKKPPKVDKIRFRLSKFSQHIQDVQRNDKNLSLTQNENPIPQKDQIILGDNLTYTLQFLQNQLKQIHQQSRKQHIRLQKIKKELNLFGPKIQRQLQRITQQFYKGLNNLQTSMSRAKTEKCSILVNWKSVIVEKVKEYEEEREMMWDVEKCVERVKRGVEGEGMKWGVVEVEDLGENEG